MSTLDTIVLNGTAYDFGGGDVETKADLPYKKTNVTLTTNAGRMTTGLTVFGSTQKYASISVTSGQKYLITGWCSSASIPCAFTVDSNNTATKLLGTVNQVYENAEITIPEGAVTLYINSKEDGTISAILLDGRYTQAEFAEKIDEIETVSDAVNNKVDLTYKLTPVEITVEDGWISKGLAVYVAGQQKHTSLSVNAGEMYAVTGGTSAANYPTAFCVDANNNVTVLNQDGFCFDKIITIPTGAVTLYVNNSVEHQIGISTAVLNTQEQVGDILEKSAKKVPNLKVLYDDIYGVRIKRKYNADYDIVITLANAGPNNLFNLTKVNFVENTDDEPNDRFIGYSVPTGWTASSDCFGPYVVKAVNNADGDYPTSSAFTGGNHLNTGNGVTAVQQSLSVMINGVKEAKKNHLYSCETVVIRWTNLVQGSNTTKADGTGRGVMTESWEAVIDNDRIKVKNRIIALEAIIISTYYGLQFNNSGMYYYFVGGSNRGVFTESRGDGAGSSGNNTCRELDMYSSAGVLKVDVGIDPVDLGLFAYNNGTSFFASNNKLYASLIMGNTLELAQGDSAFLEGYYRFH